LRIDRLVVYTVNGPNILGPFLYQHEAFDLICPTCRKSETRVVDSRDDESVVRRRRECLACKHRFTTYERIEAPRLFVVKKDGRREQYSRDKVLSGLRRACEKRPIADAALEEVVSGLERDLFTRGENEVSSSLIGEKVMEALKALDKVAYIRFASVYRSFRDVESFQAELRDLLAK
jgi:transcriptional repressor NrdR